LLSTHKRIINLGLELMGARTLQRPAGETDACAHLSPAVAEFSATVKSEGLKEAPRQGDGPFGKGEARTSPAASGEQAG
jgi:enoyl-CoA hydratase